MTKEIVVPHHAPMPNGYGFLKKGDPYLTANVRRKTHDANKKLFVVMNKSNKLGLRAPKWILKQVFDENRATKEKRQREVQRRDGAAEDEFEATTKKLFPRIPDEDLQKVIKRALKKRSGRVGRTKLLSVEKRAQLAVAAHIRHCHTKYDTLVRGPMNREKARDAIKDEHVKTMSRWGWSQTPDQGRREKKIKARNPKTSNRPHPPPETTHKQKTNREHVKQRPLPQKAGRKEPTRTSARLTRSGNGSALEMLSTFSDDEDDRASPDEDAESEGYDSNKSYEDSLDEYESESEEESEDDFATEWQSD